MSVGILQGDCGQINVQNTLALGGALGMNFVLANQNSYTFFSYRIIAGQFLNQNANWGPNADYQWFRNDFGRTAGVSRLVVALNGVQGDGGTNGGELIAIDTGGVQMAIESIMFGDVPAPYFYYSPSWEKYFVLTPPHAVGSVGVSLVLANSQTIVVEDSETNDPLEYEFYQQTLEASAAQNPAPYGCWGHFTSVGSEGLGGGI